MGPPARAKPCEHGRGNRRRDPRGGAQFIYPGTPGQDTISKPQPESGSVIERLKKIFGSETGKRDPAGGGSVHDVRMASCALFLELAGIDGEFSSQERDRILALLKAEYGLSDDDIGALIAEAEQQLRGKIDLWRFTNLINQNYDEDEKIRVVELLWRIVYSDGRLDAHEDYLIHKLSGLLRLQHDQLIDAKLKIIHDDAY